MLESKALDSCYERFKPLAKPIENIPPAASLVLKGFDTGSIPYVLMARAIFDIPADVLSLISPEIYTSGLSHCSPSYPPNLLDALPGTYLGRRFKGV